MKIRVLGSAAGGGFPQWNCNCENCAGFRAGTIQAQARTQSSIAITENGDDWVLINASPDILTQIRSAPALQPNRAIRDTGIAAVMLMDAQIDHVTGLLMLRERKQALPLYATLPVFNDLSTGFPLTRILSHYCGVDLHELPLNQEALHIAPLTHTSFTPIPLTSKAPPYSPHRNLPQIGDNIGLEVMDATTGKRLFYAPGLGEIEPHVMAAMQRADVVLVDGTLWTEDEMVRMGLSSKMSADMGHLPQTGSHGMIAILDQLPASTRKILIHINNTNPILREDSAERATLAAHGIEVAYDGMEIHFTHIAQTAETSAAL